MHCMLACTPSAPITLMGASSNFEPNNKKLVCLGPVRTVSSTQLGSQDHVNVRWSLKVRPKCRTLALLRRGDDASRYEWV